MPRIFLVLILIGANLNLYAQKAETSTNNPVSLMRTKFDGKPLIDVKYNYLSGSDYKLEMRRPESGVYEKGKLDNSEQLTVNVNVPVFYKKNLLITTFLGYNYAVTDYGKVNQHQASFPTLNHPRNQEMHFFAGGGTGMYMTKLFGKSLIFTASASLDGSQKRLENIDGLFTATMLVTQNENTQMALGIFGSTSSAMQFPFFPIFTYRHHFKDTPYIIDIILPKQVYLTRLAGSKGRLSAGFLLDTQHGYYYPNQADFKRTYTYDRIDFKLEAKYEHILFGNLIANGSVGAVKCFKGVFREKGKTKDVARFTQDAGFTFSLGMRYVLK